MRNKRREPSCGIWEKLLPQPGWHHKRPQPRERINNLYFPPLLLSLSLLTCSNWSKTLSKLDWWLFHLRQNSWSAILPGVFSLVCLSSDDFSPSVPLSTQFQLPTRYSAVFLLTSWDFWNIKSCQTQHITIFWCNLPIETIKQNAQKFANLLVK